MFSVCMYARFQASPKKCHLTTVKGILRYLKHTPNVGFWYLRGAQFELLGYSDLDYTGYKIDRKSISDYFFLRFRHMSITWKIICVMVLKEEKFSCIINGQGGVYIRG